MGDIYVIVLTIKKKVYKIYAPEIMFKYFNTNTIYTDSL